MTIKNVEHAEQTEYFNHTTEYQGETLIAQLRQVSSDYDVYIVTDSVCGKTAAWVMKHGPALAEQTMFETNRF